MSGLSGLISSVVDAARNATSSSSSGFDEQAYLRANPDVANAIAHGHFSSGLEHYQKHGRNEGRDLGTGQTSQPAQGAGSSSPGGYEFDEQAYLAQNPAVRQAVERGLFSSGREHYELHGRAEGRSPVFNQASLDRARQIEQYDPELWKFLQPAEFDGRGREWHESRSNMNQHIGMADAQGKTVGVPGFTGVRADGSTITRGDSYQGYYLGNEQAGADWMGSMEDWWGHGYFDAPITQQPNYWDYMQQGFGPGGGNADRPYPGIGGPGGSTPPPGGSTPPPGGSTPPPESEPPPSYAPPPELGGSGETPTTPDRGPGVGPPPPPPPPQNSYLNSEPPPSYAPPPEPGGSGEKPTTPDRGPGVGPPPPPPPPQNSYLNSVFSSQNGLLASRRRAPVHPQSATGYEGLLPNGLLADNRYGR